MGDAREAGRSAFQKGHELDLSEIGSKLVAVILVFQPSMAFEWWAAIEDQAGRTAVMLHVNDRPSHPVRVGFLWFSPGVGGLLALPSRCARAFGTFDRVGIALVVYVLALLVEVLPQQLD